MRISSEILCISESTRTELVELIPSAAAKTRVALLGPGLFEGPTASDTSPGTVLLVGGAPHKRNELAVRALAEANPSWLSSLVGVSLSDEADLLARDAFGERYEALSRPSDQELRDVYRRADTYVFFGLEEGFGLPYIEALAAGCNVVAIDQPLTRELLGSAAVLLEDGGPSQLAEALVDIDVVSDLQKTIVMERYSWNKFADIAFDALTSRP